MEGLFEKIIAMNFAIILDMKDVEFVFKSGFGKPQSMNLSTETISIDYQEADNSAIDLVYRLPAEIQPITNVGLDELVSREMREIEVDLVCSHTELLESFVASSNTDLLGFSCCYAFYEEISLILESLTPGFDSVEYVRMFHHVIQYARPGRSMRLLHYFVKEVDRFVSASKCTVTPIKEMGEALKGLSLLVFESEDIDSLIIEVQRTIEAISASSRIRDYYSFPLGIIYKDELNATLRAIIREYTERRSVIIAKYHILVEIFHLFKHSIVYSYLLEKPMNYCASLTSPSVVGGSPSVYIWEYEKIYGEFKKDRQDTIFPKKECLGSLMDIRCAYSTVIGCLDIMYTLVKLSFRRDVMRMRNVKSGPSYYETVFAQRYEMYSDFLNMHRFITAPDNSIKVFEIMVLYGGKGVPKIHPSIRPTFDYYYLKSLTALLTRIVDCTILVQPLVQAGLFKTEFYSRYVKMMLNTGAIPTEIRYNLFGDIMSDLFLKCGYNSIYQILCKILYTVDSEMSRCQYRYAAQDPRGLSDVALYKIALRETDPALDEYLVELFKFVKNPSLYHEEAQKVAEQVEKVYTTREAGSFTFA